MYFIKVNKITFRFLISSLHPSQDTSKLLARPHSARLWAPIFRIWSPMIACRRKDSPTQDWQHHHPSPSSLKLISSWATFAWKVHLQLGNHQAHPQSSNYHPKVSSSIERPPVQHHSWELPSLRVLCLCVPRRENPTRMITQATTSFKLIPGWASTSRKIQPRLGNRQLIPNRVTTIRKVHSRLGNCQSNSEAEGSPHWESSLCFEEGMPTWEW